MHNADAYGTQEVNNYHDRNYFFGNEGNALDSSDNYERRNDHQNDSGHPVGYAESAEHVGRDSVYLGHVAYSKGSKKTERTEQHSKNRTKHLTVLLRTKTVLQIVHRAAAPLAVLVLDAVEYTQNILREVGHHAKERHYPHPEHSAGTSGDDSRSHACDIASADRGRKRRAYALELGDLLVLGVSRDLPVLEHRADGASEPSSNVRYLEEFREH